MNKEMFFSIIIPTYNRGHLIQATIESALNQSYSNYEILVIDDGSTDNTESVVKAIKHPRIKYFKKENGERGSARNYGAAASTGEYINFFDSDDFLLPNHLATALQAVHDLNNPEFIHLGYKVLTSDGQLIENVEKLKGDINLRLIKEGNLLSCNGVFLRRDIAMAFPFVNDRALSGSEDHELWIRLASRYKIHHIGVITSSIINHQYRSVLTINMEKLIERLQLFKKYVSADQQFQKVFGKYEKYLEAQALTYISLHLALIKTENLTAAKYLLKGFAVRPGIFFTRRFWAINKHLLLSIFSFEGEKFVALENTINPADQVNGDILFSVIIPTYNRAAFITKSIESVVNQKYINYEIIIVDDGSDDGTEEVIKRHKFNKLSFYRIQNSERASARNYGMSKANGSYITFLDSDDLFNGDYLANAYESIKKFDQPDFLHLAYVSMDAEIGKVIRKFIIKNDDILCLVKGNPLSCIGIFLKREITENYRFNEDRNLSGSEDWELWLRIAANYGLKTDNRISGALMVHKSRSVFNYPEERLVLRKNIALNYAFEDPAVREKFGPHKVAMEAFCDSYISLHLVLSGKNSKAFSYLTRAFYIYPLTIFDIRTIAIFKFLFLNLIGLRK